jgi:hypothetical protein
MRLLVGYGLLLGVLAALLCLVVSAQSLRTWLRRLRGSQAWDGVERRAKDREHRPPAGTAERRRGLVT